MSYELENYIEHSFVYEQSFGVRGDGQKIMHLAFSSNVLSTILFGIPSASIGSIVIISLIL